MLLISTAEKQTNKQKKTKTFSCTDESSKYSFAPTAALLFSLLFQFYYHYVILITSKFSSSLDASVKYLQLYELINRLVRQINIISFIH